MEKKSDIKKPASRIRKPSKTREPKVVTSEMRSNKKGDPQSQQINKPEKENDAQKVEQTKEQQPVAHQENQTDQKPKQKIVNEDEQKQVVNNSPGASPTEAEDQK